MICERECHHCRHHWYLAPNGQPPLKPEPHACCLMFGTIPLTIEKLPGCDGTLSPQITHWNIPSACPKYSQKELFA